MRIKPVKTVSTIPCFWQKLLTIIQVDKSATANMIAPNNVILQPTLSVVSAATPATWRETVQIASEDPIGAMDPREAHLEGLLKAESVEEMVMTVNTSSSCRNSLAERLPEIHNIVLKLGLGATTTGLAVVTVTAIATSNLGSEARPGVQHRGNSAATTAETTITVTEGPRLHGHGEMTIMADIPRAATEALQAAARRHGSDKTTLLPLPPVASTAMRVIQVATATRLDLTADSKAWGLLPAWVRPQA